MFNNDPDNLHYEQGDFKRARSFSFSFNTPYNDSSNSSSSCQIVIDDSENILKVLKTLWRDQSMCDVFFKVDGKQYGAHRFILSSNSDVFQAMLMNSAWTEWKESHIELQELPLCEAVFPSFLEYFYTGKILITHTNVVPILALADKYLVKSLQRNCMKYMCYHVPHAAYHDQLSPWLQYSHICNHIETLTSCKNFFKWNFEAVAKTSDYGNIDCDIFVNIISCDDVVIHNEMMLYHYAVRWLDLQKAKTNQSPKEYKELVESVMSNIRFPMMTPRELAELLISPLIKQHEQFFVDRMAIGMKYHSGFEDELASHYSHEKYLFVPRLYTSDSRSAVLNIDNFWDLQSYHVSTFLFSSLLSAAEHEAHKISEWEVKLYPKGVHFKKCFLICWQGTLEVPEEILKTVRLSLTCGETPRASVRVKVSVLIYGIQGGVEHVMQIIEKSHCFSPQNNILNMDDIIPFHVLNPIASIFKTAYENPYLIGPNKDQLKLTIVIAPIH